MGVRRPPEVTPLGLNLAPMVDVMMCLLIFFMLATKMVERESEQIDLPAAATARGTEKRSLGSRVVVNVDARGAAGAEYTVDGAPLSAAELGRRLAGEAARDSEVTCYIRADREVAYGFVEPILLECARLKISNVTFAAAMTGEGR